jgi:hypothetical protein
MFQKHRSVTYSLAIRLMALYYTHVSMVSNRLHVLIRILIQGQTWGSIDADRMFSGLPLWFHDAAKPSTLNIQAIQYTCPDR